MRSSTVGWQTYFWLVTLVVSSMLKEELCKNQTMFKSEIVYKFDHKARLFFLQHANYSYSGKKCKRKIFAFALYPNFMACRK